MGLNGVENRGEAALDDVERLDLLREGGDARAFRVPLALERRDLLLELSDCALGARRLADGVYENRAQLTLHGGVELVGIFGGVVHFLFFDVFGGIGTRLLTFFKVGGVELQKWKL